MNLIPIQRALAAVMILTGGVPLAAPAAEEAREEFRRLERDIPSLYLLNGLFLSPAQNGQLAGLLEQTERVEQDVANRVESLARRYGDADTLLRFTPNPGQPGKPPRPPAGLQDARRLREDRDRRIRDLAQDAYELLTPAQVEIIESFTPCFIPPGDFRNPVRVGQAESHLGIGEPILRRLREVPESRLDEASRRAVEILTPYVLQKRHVQFSEEAEAGVRQEIETALAAELPRIRSLSDVDLELEKEDILCRLVPVATKDGSTDEQLKKIGAFVLNAGCLDVVRERGGTPARAVPPRLMTATDPRDVHESSQRLRAMRLLAGLDLTSAQAARLLPVARAALEARREVEQHADDVKGKALTDYRQLRRELADGNPTRETETACNHWHQAVKAIYEQDLVSALRPYEDQVDPLLSAGQSAMLAASANPPSPGSVPPPPARRQHMLAIRVLDRARQMTNTKFKQDGPDLADRFVRECVGENDDLGVDIPTESDRVFDVMEKTRQLGASAYRQQKRSLVTDMSPRRSAPRETAYGAKYDRGEPLPILGPGAELLFTEAGAELIAALAKQKP
ncbi:MAG: hypothetical protein KKC51_00890 [Verrucomicrobia bacterium]|nr:hypothetical protein [Verrucomicrobiota bacterium]